MGASLSEWSRWRDRQTNEHRSAGDGVADRRQHRRMRRYLLERVQQEVSQLWSASTSSFMR